MVNTTPDIYERLREYLDKMPVPFPATESGVEIRLLKKLFSEEEAALSLHLSALPEKASKIHGRINDSNLPLEIIEKRLQEMVKKGLIRGVKSRKNPSVTKYGRMPLAIGMFEAQVDQITKGVAEDFFDYEKEAFGEAILGQKTKQMRTIPLNVRIRPEFHVGNYDDIRKIIDRSPGPFAVMNCVCKQAKDVIGHSCKKTDDRESCILLEGGVQFAESLGVGKEISKKEVLNLVKKAKKDGLVLQPENTQQPHFICCCCGCCCGVLTAAKLYDKPSQFLHSNYFAEVDAAKCSLCETCLERCPMDALHQTDNHMEVNNDRCIGCGACIPTCPDHALALVQKENCYVPPASTMEMYKNIMVERFGWTGTIKIAAKAGLGMKV